MDKITSFIAGGGTLAAIILNLWEWMQNGMINLILAVIIAILVIVYRILKIYYLIKRSKRLEHENRQFLQQIINNKYN